MPYQLTVATFFENVVDDGIVALLLAILVLAVVLGRELAVGVDRQVPGLAHVPQRAEIQRLKLELSILDAKFLVICD